MPKKPPDKMFVTLSDDDALCLAYELEDSNYYKTGYIGYTSESVLVFIREVETRYTRNNAIPDSGRFLTDEEALAMAYEREDQSYLKPGLLGYKPESILGLTRDVEQATIKNNTRIESK